MKGKFLTQSTNKLKVPSKKSLKTIISYIIIKELIIWEAFKNIVPKVNHMDGILEFDDSLHAASFVLLCRNQCKRWPAEFAADSNKIVAKESENNNLCEAFENNNLCEAIGIDVSVLM